MICRSLCSLSLLTLLSLSARSALAAPGSTEPPSPAEDGTLKALSAIAGEGMMDSHAYGYLQELSDDIGGRVTGTPQAAKAVEWGLARMRSMGLENVHAETWQISRGWTRGSAEAELLSPVHHRLLIDSMGWTGSTTGSVEAGVVAVNINQIDDEIQQNSSHWAGKILLIVKRGFPKQGGMLAFARFGPFLKTAYAAHALAVIGGQAGSKSVGMNMTHTGAMGFDTFYDIPVVSMGAEDQDQLERFLDRGKAIRIRISVQNRVTSGPVESANVVGEIRGTQFPEQIIVAGGHLDSWDLAAGTTDNGCGVTVALGAAEAILKSGFKPLRTIRFVLFTGEEEGLLGSFAYVKTHQNEMANHIAAIILDNGQGPVNALELGGRTDLVPALQQFAMYIQAFGDIDVNDDPVFGTDTGPFILAGLPGINLGQDSPDYKFTHHSAVDTFDKVKPDILIRNATIMAVTAFWIAGRPERLDTPWPAEKTARMLTEKKQDAFLKAFGLWPFGDLGAEPKD